ncbi:MAG: paraquat-inducible protein A [Balneola sp.]
MKRYKIPLLIFMLMGVLLSSISIYRLESQKRILQTELIELSKVKYGIFSVDEWEAELSEIIVKRLNEFELEDQKEDELRETISEFLNSAVDELEESFHERNSGSLKGFLKGSVANITDVFGVMKDDIPLLTDSIIAFINDPKNKELAKDFLLQKMEDYSDKTFSDIDYTIYNKVLAKHDAPDKETARLILHSKIGLLEYQQKPYSILLFSIVLILILGLFFTKEFKKADFLLLTIICSCLLLVGLLLPMINIDARISKMEFQLMGETITFTDQVLYFKSKSILEVVSVMIQSVKPDVIAVGVLVLSFSVLFPVSKLTSSLFYIYSEKLQKNPVIKFMVFKTAKWSMADVMVVAIFMAYIGFSGIISEQLKDLENITTYFDMMTTNASSLQIGFFVFTSFALLSLLISHKLQYSNLE